MSSEETWVIQTAELVVGTSLSFDLNDADGAILHKAGMPISDRLLERLQKKNIHSVTVKGRSREVNNADSVLLSYYDQVAIQDTQRIIAKNEESLRNFHVELLNGQSLDPSKLKAGVDQFVAQAIKDSSAAFAVLSSCGKVVDSELAEKFSRRSNVMALMAVTAGVCMGYSGEECAEVGMAGLLHDCSLVFHPEWFDDGKLDDIKLEGGTAKITDLYRNHPVESASLLKACPNLSDSVLTAIQQVHEQIDGSGYPNALSGDEIYPLGRVLNAADSYLNMVQPFMPIDRVLPSDALAHLCHNAIKGRFDRRIIRGFVNGMSIYPIGSVVELDDKSLAVVVRSNLASPLEPIVRLLDESLRLADLQNTHLNIVGPANDTAPAVTRMTLAKLDQMLWRNDIQMEVALT